LKNVFGTSWDFHKSAEKFSKNFEPLYPLEWTCGPQNIKNYWKWHVTKKVWPPLVYIKGSQPFGTCVPPNLNFTPLHTPKSTLYPLRVPPNKKLYPLWASYECFFNILRTPCKILTYSKGFAYPRLRNAGLCCFKLLLSWLLQTLIIINRFEWSHVGLHL
jgi:hypothetical protein